MGATNRILKKGVKGFLCAFCVLFVCTMPVFSQIKIVASVPVVARIVTEILGGEVVLTTLTQPGASAHVFEPSALQVRQIREADIFFAIPSLSHERGYLRGIRRLNPRLEIIDLENSVPQALKKIKALKGDPHIWMTPQLLSAITKKILDVLVLRYPEQESLYRQRAGKLSDLFAQEDRLLREAFASMPKLAFLTYHPSFGYFAEAYGLTQYALEREGKSMSAGHFHRVLSQAKASGVTAFLVHPGIDAGMVGRVVKTLSCTPVTIDVLDPDIVSVWHRIREALIKESL